MKKLLLLATMLTIGKVASADGLYNGFILTKNGIRLTGKIGAIFYSDYRSEVVFINDFGTKYLISPQLIRGFAFTKDSTVAYESKINDRSWCFLEVLQKDEGMSLYKSPIEKVETVRELSGVKTYSITVHEYWLELKGKRPVLVRRLGFRRQLQKMLRKVAPELSEKIGSPGYRFRDLNEIVAEYNKIYKETRWIL